MKKVANSSWWFWQKIYKGLWLTGAFTLNPSKKYCWKYIGYLSLYPSSNKRRCSGFNLQGFNWQTVNWSLQRSQNTVFGGIVCTVTRQIFVRLARVAKQSIWSSQWPISTQFCMSYIYIHIWRRKQGKSISSRVCLQLLQVSSNSNNSNIKFHLR